MGKIKNAMRTSLSKGKLMMAGLRGWKGLSAVATLALIVPLAGGVVPPMPDALAKTPWPMFQHDLRHTGQSPYLGAQTNVIKWTYATGWYIGVVLR